MSFLKKLFRRDPPQAKALAELNKTKADLAAAIDDHMEKIESEINDTRQLAEKWRNHGIRRFDNLFNIALQVTVTSADLLLLSSQIRLSNRRFERLLSARTLALVLIEYLKDINTHLGHHLVEELKTNQYHELIPAIKDVNKEFADLRKQHEAMLTPIRNNIAAHKTKDALTLVHFLFKLNPDEIYDLALDVIRLNTQLNHLITDIYNRMAREGRKNKKERGQ